MRAHAARALGPLIWMSLVATAVACGGGSAPELESIPDQVVAVGSELTIPLRATDPDGDKIAYSFHADVPDLGDRATVNPTAVGTALFQWRPLASDVGTWHFDFIASDGDLSTTVPVTIEVRSAVGDQTTPVFRQPLGSGTTLDLAVRMCLDLDIVVEDQDSASVTITQEDPIIEGATLEATSGLAAVWRWCPTRAQIDADDRYTLTLAADDGENPRTIKNYLIVLRRVPEQNCPGTPPVVTHTPANESTLVDLTIDATITDDMGLKQPPLLYHATTSPGAPPNLANMTQTTMLLITGDMRSGTWAADIPNPVASMPQGSTATIYYVIVANDDDDEAGTCDHETQAPTGTSYQMTVTNPGGAGGVGLCESCSADVQCGGAADNCVRVGTTNHCLQACAAPGNTCPSGYTCSAAAVTSVNGASARQCIPTAGVCGATMTCTDDFFENNDTRAQAALLPDLDPDTYNFTSCPLADGSNDDEDWFPIILTADATVTLTLAGQSVSDLDLGLYDATGVRLTSATGPTSMETITRCLTPGTYYVRVYAWGAGAENDYTLTYARAAGACPMACTDDPREPDDDAMNARSITYPDFMSTGNQICAGDDDWYRVLMFNGEVLTVDLTFTQMNSTQDLDLHFYNASGTDLTPCTEAMPSTCSAAQGQGVVSNEHYTFTAPAACSSLCTYYVVVHGWSGSQNSYSIRIQVP